MKLFRLFRLKSVVQEELESLRTLNILNKAENEKLRQKIELLTVKFRELHERETKRVTRENDLLRFENAKLNTALNAVQIILIGVNTGAWFSKQQMENALNALLEINDPKKEGTSDEKQL